MTKFNRDVYIINPIAKALELHDALSERLSKANALAQFATTESICEHVNERVQHYLWALSQIIHEAWELNDTLAKYTPSLPNDEKVKS